MAEGFSGLVNRTRHSAALLGDVFTDNVLAVGNGSLPYLIPYRAAVLNNRRISGGSPASEPTTPLENGEHHPVIVEQPIIVGRQISGADEMTGATPRPSGSPAPDKSAAGQESPR